MEKIVVIHIIASVFMCGLCWFVQIVHYPLFKFIDLDNFPNYQTKNYITGFLTVPVMVVELFTALYIVDFDPSGIWIINLVLILIIGMSTMIFQVPTHIRLKYSPTPSLFSKLIKTNWIRTISWTVRVFILAYWLLNRIDI